MVDSSGQTETQSTHGPVTRRNGNVKSRPLEQQALPSCARAGCGMGYKRRAPYTGVSTAAKHDAVDLSPARVTV